MIDNPKELKPDHFKWLEKTVYSDLGKLQINLNEVEREMLVNQLATSIKIYEKLILDMPRVRNVLYQIYDKFVSTGSSTSPLSNQFNMSRKGHNIDVRKKIDKVFHNAYNYEKLGKGFEAATQLGNADLNYDILFGPRITSIIESSNTLAAIELLRIKQFREKLFLSIIRMATSIARNYSLNHQIIEWSDLTQEAILASLKVVEKYRPIEGGKTFTSFAYTWINGVLNKKISEGTRTVSIPRSNLDRYGYVQKAIDSLGLMITDLRGGINPLNTLTVGKIDYPTLCLISDRANFFRKGGKKFSAEEVRKLLLITQEEISLDLEVGEGEGPEESITLKETIPDESLNAEQLIDGILLKRRLFKIIQEYSSEEEFAILRLRYGTGEFRGCKWASDAYHQATGKPMNKGRISWVEKQVLNRIHKEMKKNPDLKKQLEEILGTLPFLTK